MDRRKFLIGLGGTAAVGLTPSAARAGGTLHVGYPGTHTADEARELLQLIAVQLGPAVARDLRVARRGDDHVVIYDRSAVRDPGDRAAARRVADKHDEILRRALDEDRPMADVVPSLDLAELYDIQYGAAGPLDALRPSWDRVAVLLGPGVAKHLVIERTDDAHCRLVYKRSGDEASTRRVAAHHASLLARSGLTAAAVPDRFFPVVADGSSAPAAPPPAPTVVATPTEPSPAPADDHLTTLIDAHVKGYRSKGLVDASERTSWIVHDLRADSTLAAINADVPRQAASMIKPWVALAFLHEVARGRFVYGARSREHLEAMIRDSSNTATNWAIDQVGGPGACASLIERHYGALASGLTLVERIPEGGRTYRNKATARDHARLLRAIWRGEVPMADELRRILNLPGPDRLYHGVPEIPVGTEVYNKTGSTAMCCGDMGVLVARTAGGERVPYVLVGVIERDTRCSGYTSWIRSRGNVIRSVSGVVYEALKGRYQLA